MQISVHSDISNILKHCVVVPITFSSRLEANKKETALQALLMRLLYR